ncbi:MAG: CDP-diacylglycerol--serine O-phosphatidyltransferase [Alphaproteobacteria bacterium]|nr:MAG: CDP-diacylglycerol--serine O-phosphatidyltransferase [Alphaproteobacteria bacterium]
MHGNSERPRTSELPLIQLLPNFLTIAAICAGLTAIRFGFQGNYERAVLLILAAAILDGLDGRLARALKSDSKMGAELDSLADFLNFGIAPPLVIYFWALQDTKSMGWMAVLTYAVCCVVRLARFNVTAKAEQEEGHSRSDYFVGVPSPAGAMLVMLPMFMSFSIATEVVFHVGVIMGNMVLIGLLLISRIPTWSFKAITISRQNVKFILVGFAFLAAALMTYAWVTLVVLCLAYVAGVVWALASGKVPRKHIKL